MSDGYKFCPACYSAAIDRLCTGFSHRYSRSLTTREYGPLPDRVAIGVRRTAVEILASRPMATRPDGHTHGVGS